MCGAHGICGLFSWQTGPVARAGGGELRGENSTGKKSGEIGTDLLHQTAQKFGWMLVNSDAYLVLSAQSLRGPIAISSGVATESLDTQVPIEDHASRDIVGNATRWCIPAFTPLSFSPDSHCASRTLGSLRASLPLHPLVSDSANPSLRVRSATTATVGSS